MAIVTVLLNKWTYAYIRKKRKIITSVSVFVIYFPKRDIKQYYKSQN